MKFYVTLIRLQVEVVEVEANLPSEATKLAQQGEGLRVNGESMPWRAMTPVAAFTEK